jgi:NAD(P)-dependent dehydrogenase (short-subunit alcohol dehydrogenase family)
MSKVDAHGLRGKVAVVTGAGRGIGREVALLLGSLGVRTVINDLGVAPDGTRRDEGPACDVAGEINASGGQAIANYASVAEWDGAASIIQDAIDSFGRINILVNVAGLSSSSPVQDLGEDEFRTVIGASLLGTFFCMKHAAPHMIAQGGGRIVNFVSRAGLVGIGGASAYAAAKGGVFGLTNALACELLPHGIFVNGVNPAATRTRMVGGSGAQGGATEIQKRMMAVMQEPATVAATTAYLCSEACRLSGQYVLVEKDGIGLLSSISSERKIPILPDEWTVEHISHVLAQAESAPANEIYQ